MRAKKGSARAKSGGEGRRVYCYMDLLSRDMGKESR